MKAKYLLLVLIGCLLALSMVPDDPADSARTYDEMVLIYERTGGEYGWPPKGGLNGQD